MKAMVFAAGIGSRLADLTKNRPKCLMEAGGSTMLAHVCTKLKRAGVSEIMINVHHCAQQVMEHVRSCSGWGLKAHFSEESSLLGTGGGLQKVAEFFRDQEYFIVHNSDVYTDFDLSVMVETCKERDAVAVLATKERSTSRPLLFDCTGQLAGWENHNNGTGERFGKNVDLISVGFTGIHVVTPRIIPFLVNYSPPFSIMEAYFDAARQDKLVCRYDIGGSYWIDIGVPERLQELQELLKPMHLLN